MRRTKTDEELAAAADAFADDPERADLLQRARRFKNSWLELADALVAARKAGSWKRWGYDSFEAYAKQELHLRQDTVDKLTRSFSFLKANAPEVLERDGVHAPIPSMRSVDFLRRAEEESHAPKEVVADVRRRVLDENTKPERLLRDYGATVFPIDDATRAAKDRAGLRNVASRLRVLLDESDVVPKRLAQDLASRLDELLGIVTPREDAA